MTTSDNPRYVLLRNVREGILFTVEQQARVARQEIRAASDEHDMSYVGKVVESLPPYFFTREFVELSMAQDQVDVEWHNDILPTDGGFACLGWPLELSEVPEGRTRDLVGSDLVMSEFFWRTTGNDVFVFFRVGDAETLERVGLVGGMWNRGESLLERVAQHDADDPQHVFRLCLPVFAQLMVMANQRISETSSELLPRPMRRRGVAAPSEGAVRVVHLRRRTKESDGEQDVIDVDWSHRWVVRGHWRQQWYPSRNVHEPIFVSPYVKGPEDKPLVIKNIRYAVDQWR